MKGKIVAILVAVAMVCSLSLAMMPSAVAANGVKDAAIDDGMAWLAAQQDDTTGAWSLGYYPVGVTAFAVLKFEHHAKEILHIDPFDPTYVYKGNIEAGLQYLFENAHSVAIGPQDAGNPDVALPNGLGVYFVSPGGNHITYETGIVMMALEASCHPAFIVVAPGSDVDTWTYLDVMKDTVDYVAWGQNEGGSERGGWGYQGNDVGWSDNSNSQWPVLGLMSAAAPGWGVSAPGWVKTELEDYWLAYSQGAGGCFGYTGPPPSQVGGFVAVTASGLIQLTYCGVPTTDPRWQDGAACICTEWETAGSNIGNYYAMYSVMKAGMTAQPKIVWDFVDDDVCSHNWQDEYDAWLLATQNVDGSWSADGDWATQLLATEWALLILQKVAPPPPPPVGGEVYPISVVGSETGVSPLWVGLGVVLILAAGGGVLVLRHRRAH